MATGPPAARNGGRAAIFALAVILLLGLGLRIDYAAGGRSPVYDAVAYSKIARNLDRGEGFTAGPTATQPSTDYSPGLPLLVAGVYALSGGPHEELARIALALLGSLSVLFTYLIGRRLSGVAAGLIGALAVAVYPAFLEYQGMLMTEPLAATLLSASVLSVLWASDLPSRAWRWLLPGALLGATAMVRPEYLLVAVLISLVVFARGARADWRRSLAHAAILLAAVAALVAPWTVRNLVALDRFVPISTGGGQALFAGTYLPSDGDPLRVGSEVVARHPAIFAPADARRLRLEQILARLAASRYPRMDPDAALARMGREQLSSDLADHTWRYAGFLATKVGAIWSHGPRGVMRRPVWEALHWALVGFGLLGLVVLAAGRRRWEALLVGVIFVSITAIGALLVASPRRTLVMMPLIAACAGTGAVWLWAYLSQVRTMALANPRP